MVWNHQLDYCKTLSLFKILPKLLVKRCLDPLFGQTCQTAIVRRYLGRLGNGCNLGTSSNRNSLLLKETGQQDFLRMMVANTYKVIIKSKDIWPMIFVGVEGNFCKLKVFCEILGCAFIFFDCSFLLVEMIQFDHIWCVTGFFLLGPVQLLLSTVRSLLQDGSGRVDLQEILDWLLYASWFLQKLLAMILCFSWE